MSSVISPAASRGRAPEASSAAPFPLGAHLASLTFLFGALGLGIFSCLYFGFDEKKIFLYFLLPYYTVALALQYVFPDQPNRFERGEVLTDVLNNGGLVFSSGLQTLMLAWLAGFVAQGQPYSLSLLFNLGLLDPSWSAGHWPFWAQVLLQVLLFDFMFYVTHRVAHEVDFFWRFHSVHHCAHRLSVLNASRAHPIDMAWRRLLPIFVVLQTGIGTEAFVMGGVIGSILATITHMNVDFRFGWVNGIYGSNEIHRWHHSNKIEEAKNFSMIMIWDRLLGTYVNPPDRRRPAQMGLFNETLYPIHRFGGQLLIPFRWKSWKRRQAEAAQQAGRGR